MKTRYFIRLAYNGKPFHGWQIQENAITVQEELNNALSTILREEINVVGAGRTDTGVHATYFMAHFDLTYQISDKDLIINKLNKMLPRDIAIFEIRQVRPDANARFDAISRTYEYKITRTKNPFLTDFAWLYKVNLDVGAMNHAAKYLLDYQDFTSFSKTGTQVATNNCIIYFAQWFEQDAHLIFRIKADRFLRNMVRAIVGTLVDVGLGRKNTDDFRKIIEAKNRSIAGFSVPAHGLYLVDIEYPKELFIG